MNCFSVAMTTGKSHAVHLGRRWQMRRKTIAFFFLTLSLGLRPPPMHFLQSREEKCVQGAGDHSRAGFQLRDVCGGAGGSFSHFSPAEFISSFRTWVRQLWVVATFIHLLYKYFAHRRMLRPLIPSETLFSCLCSVFPTSTQARHPTYRNPPTPCRHLSVLM